MSLLVLSFIIVFQAGIFLITAITQWKDYRNKGLGFGKIPRILLSLSMVITSGILFLNQTSFQGSNIMIVIGMLFSFFGDLVMAAIIKTKNRLAYGMFLFSFTHISYTIAYLAVIWNNTNSSYLIGFYIAILVLILLICRMIYSSLQKQNEHENSKEFKNKKYSIIYGGIIFNMFLSSFLLYVTLGGRWWTTTLFAIIFMISDGIIALKDIAHKNIKHSEFLIWLTYVIAQMGIICSILI